MNESTAVASPVPPASAPAAARAVLQLLRRLQHGTLDVQLPDGSQARFGTGGAPLAAIRLQDWRVCTQVLRSGDVGFAEAWMAGAWSTPDLAALLKLLVANRDALEAVIYGHCWGRLAYRLRHLLRRNTRRGARRNIHAHYDLGNEFYRLWLDPGMAYSSAWFEGDPGRPLEQAQVAKMRRALCECGLQPGQRLLEIGCGWGGLAGLAASEFGARVIGVTLSSGQLAWARARMHEAGLDGQVTLRLQDYRDIDDGPYDAICSIEMFEAVGREYWEAYFDALRRLLKPGGRACIQTITIRDDLFPRYVRGTDFVQQYVFPGGLLPSPGQFRGQARRAGLEVVRELAFGADYAETLRRWRASFLAQDAQVRRLGFDTRFMRLWEFYLAYCEAAFDTGSTDVMQFTLHRPA
jgi:cyclopropane-fatty-acyl-phospholipid synthase